MKSGIALALGVWMVAGAPVGGGSKAPVDGPKARAAAKAKRTRTVNLKGVVTAVDAAAGTFTVRDAAGAELILAAGPEARIRKAGKAVALAELASGDRVALTHDHGSDRPRAWLVKVLPGPSGH